MPTFEVTASDGKVYEVTAPEGATEAQIIQFAQAQVKASPPVSVRAGQEINSIPRQLGLTARYALEGPAQAAQIVTEPLRKFVTDPAVNLYRSLTGQSGNTLSSLVTGQKPQSVPLGQLASEFADRIGLPKPEGANERVIGEGTRLGFGAGGLGAAARAAGRVSSNALQFTGRNAPAVAQGIWQRTVQQLGEGLPQQISSAAGAGLAGSASQEAGGNPLMQFGAAVGGGVLGGFAGQPAANALASVEKAMRNPSKAFRAPSPQELDVQISTVLSRAGYDYSQVPERVKQSLRQEFATAMNTGGEISPTALSRLADFRLVGATPTRGMISQDPVQITREMNLAKIGANAGDDALHGLPQIQNQNNATFVRRLDEQGAERGNLQRAGETVIGSIVGQQQALRGREQAAWNAARQSAGYTQPIEANVISQINGALGDEGLMPFMNPTISRYMEAFMNGQQPFTPQAYRNLQSMLAREISKGGNEGAAARVARNVLEQAELRPITNPRGIDFGNAPVTQATAAAMRTADAAPGQSIDLVNRARAATRNAYAFEDSNPLVRSVLSEGASSDPLRVAQRYVIGGTPNEAENLVRQVGPEGIPPLRDALLAHLKDKALSDATSEVGKFSQAAYNKALKAIGDEKLRLFFSPEEITQLRALGRVSSLAMNQPVGSAVNNSNSGALAIGRTLDALRTLGYSLPAVGPFAQGINVVVRTKQAQNAAQGLLMPTQRPPVGQSLLLPAAAYGGGLLAAP